jgi:fibronectin type 3 domain-containing protein
VAVVVQKKRPILITSPTNGTVVSEEEAITFSASATDQEDGNISANIEWRSNVDGILGTGATIQVQLSSGNHTISATVTDSNNQNANSSLSIEVNANVGMASITWTAPTQNTDDTELTNLTGFKIYYGEVESNLDVSITIDDSDAYAWVIEDLKPGTTYYFAVTAVNSQGIESAFSSIASKFIPG